MTLSAEDAFLQIEEILAKVKPCAEGELKDMVRTLLDTEAADPFEDIVDAIREHLRDETPLSGEDPGEKIRLPNTGDFAGHTERDSAHVDSYLYDDDVLDTLVEDGKFSLHYCDACGSRDTKPLNMHSHSLPHDALRYLFTDVLTPEETKGKALLDVGSRTGAVLYTAALYVNHAVVPEDEAGDFQGDNRFSSIKGIELSSFFSELQVSTAEKFGLAGQVKVLNMDVFSEAGLAELAAADVLCLNNVFQFFAEEDAQRAAWSKLQGAVKKGAVLITVPSLEESLELLGLSNTWATEAHIHYPCSASDEMKAIHKYIKD
eukprot:TRINITY_DN14636_c0_g1_i1.p1 TRINITY_DN14636_c0_g1~~TRINITY_DN14636_c0_g1_i1.p1  ORF type:complete len:351 (+),score=164.26 TRINITY_DN14636_c0_g1_i1:102-1055(+)